MRSDYYLIASHFILVNTTYLYFYIMQLNRFIALTHLRARMGQTIVAGLGVMFGIGIFVFMLGFVTGLNKLMDDLLVEKSPHIRIFNEISAAPKTLVHTLFPHHTLIVHSIKPIENDVRIKNGFEILKILEKYKGVKAVAPLVSSQVIFAYGPAQVSGLIHGIDVVAEDKLINLHENVNGGKLTDLLTLPNGLIVGEGLAKKMNVKIGDNITAVSPAGIQTVFKIVATVSTGQGQLDDMRCYTTIKAVQNLLGKDRNYITDINLKLADPMQAVVISKDLQKQLNYRAQSWIEANEDMLAARNLRQYILLSVVVAILVVAGFGIYNILSMMINEKMNDIAILKALGLTGNDVRSIFLWEAIIIGFVGGLAGLLLGFVLSYIVGSIPFRIRLFPNMRHLPVDMNPIYYLVGWLFGIITTTLAGYLPARKAAYVDPILILRGK
jgi:lipoprotein-releasing system permease protein